MKAINTPKAPAAVGPYSQAIDAGSLVFTSGQIPLDPTDGTMPDGPAAQTKQAMENVRSVLEATGTGLHKVVKVTIFLKEMEHFSVVNEVYAGFFSEPYPARCCVQAARLPKDALVEIEAIALK